MKLLEWEQLPQNMKNEEVLFYYNILKLHKGGILAKSAFDMSLALVLLILLSPAMAVIGLLIKRESQGPVFFRQVRVTQYGKEFKILKFRTMVVNAEQLGAQVTSSNDARITKIGSRIRKYRLDEIPQLINILKGEMTFVGTRPEVKRYVDKYTPEMMATLLLPAGITSEASIRYKDEEKILTESENVDETYVKLVLPEKMKFNLKSMEKFSFFDELKTMFRTVTAVIEKDDKNEGNSEVPNRWEN